MFTCTTMRTAVLISLGLLIGGLLLQFFAEMTVFALPLSTLAVILVLAAAALLAIVFVLALFPATARRLNGCQH